MQDKISLKEIAGWQLNPEQSEVELHSVQRGFVWKPQQIENLWDSILREFPIGSFLFSKTGNKYHLMDGQQRATSIFLGYYNPFTNNSTKAWSIKGKLPVLWIDIQPHKRPHESRYLLRLTTLAHPWGYKSENNEVKLDFQDRKRGLELFRKNINNKNGGYTSFENTTVFPYDAAYPLPLSFFIESETIEHVIEMAEKNLPDYFCTKYGGFENKDSFLTKLKKDDLQEQAVLILKSVKKAITKNLNYDIVANSVLREENETDDPTVFVRFNKSGTTLSGDDLIYSIYKATFPETKSLVEEIGINFIAPTQVISFASRIAASDINDNTYTARMSVKDFQRKIKDTNFKEKLKYLIDSNNFKDLFEKAIDILSCKNNSLFVGEIPPVIIKHFIKRSQELFWALMYWLYKNKINDERIQLKITAKLLLFSWFGKDNNKFVRECWDKIIKYDFWEQPINEYLWERIHFVLPPALLRSYYSQPQVEDLFWEEKEHKWDLLEDGTGKEIIHHFITSKSQNFELQTANHLFWGATSKIRQNKQMILFAQREYINSTFADYNQMNDIEDTNVPWDWDHIYPDSWVYYKQGVPPIIRDWNNSNGNLRALSLEDNRRRGNQQSPKELVNVTERENSFIEDNDWKFWEQIDNRIEEKEEEKAKNHFRAITARMINIYEKFWEDLKIESLIKNIV